MFNNESYQCLAEQGYMIVRNAIPLEKIALLKQDFEKFRAIRIAEGFVNENYKMVHGDAESPAIVKDEVFGTLAKIHAHTDITADVISSTAIYFDMSLQVTRWHQDHDPYYMWQDTYNSINFWIPIEKEHADQSGIAVVPFSRLPDRKRFERGGAKDFLFWDGATQVTDDYTGEEYQLPFNFDDLAVVPNMLPGDIMVLRNDTIHKTQSFEGNRIAVSIRCFPKDGVITRDFLQTGGREKMQRMLKYPAPYKRIYQACKENGTGTAFLHQVFDYIKP